VSPSAEQAREQARSILEQRRYRDSDLPRPLHGFLHWLGIRMHEAAHALDDVLPGGAVVVLLVVAVLALGGALLAASSLARSRGPGVSRARARSGAEAVDPDALDREADEAERAGDLERALRLRFRAGTLRLARRRVLDDPASVTTGGLVRRLESEPFTLAARRFDEVVYGRRDPTAEDAQLVRDGWNAALGA
jgi:Domain of unknown function (DUF4129)